MFTLETTNDLVKFGDKALALGDFNPKGIAYLLQYGLNKSLQDSVAGTKKILTDAYIAQFNGLPNEDQVKEMKTAAGDLGVDLDNFPENLDCDTFVAKVIEVRRNARLHDIINGVMGESKGRAPALTPLERHMKDFAIETIRNACLTHNKPMFKGETLAVAVMQFLTKNEKKARAEAERRIAAAAKNDSVDLDFLFGEASEDEEATLEPTA